MNFIRQRFRKLSYYTYRQTDRCHAYSETITTYDNNVQWCINADQTCKKRNNYDIEAYYVTKVSCSASVNTAEDYK